jgi:Beta propeller domain
MTTSSQDTGSEILQDHRALLFDKARDIILSIPVSSHESYGEPLAHDGMKGHLEPGRWNGFYVFGIDPENGFELKARIEYNSSGDYIMVVEAGHSSLAAPCTLLRRNK